MQTFALKHPVEASTHQVSGSRRLPQAVAQLLLHFAFCVYNDRPVALVTRSRGFAIHWLRTWGFVIPQPCVTPSHNILLLRTKITKNPATATAAGKKCNTYEKILFYSSSFWLSSYSLRRRFCTSVGTCWYSAYFMVKVPRPEVSELSEVE